MGSYWSHEDKVGIINGDQEETSHQHAQQLVIKIENQDVGVDRSENSSLSSYPTLNSVVPFYIYGQVDVKTAQTLPQKLHFRSDRFDYEDDSAEKALKITCTGKLLHR